MAGDGEEVFGSHCRPGRQVSSKSVTLSVWPHSAKEGREVKGVEVY